MIPGGPEVDARRLHLELAGVEAVHEAELHLRHAEVLHGRIALVHPDLLRGVLAVGAAGVFSFEGYGDFPVLVEELDPPRMIAYRWSNDDARGTQSAEVDPDHSTLFRFTLEAREFL